ncbi:MAG: M15 family metallopeptidase [Clostridia bacterium]|nr:M15 family metallopeptidase [Clostridia bacterium]
MHKKSVRIAVAALALTALLSSCGRGKLPQYDYEIDMKDYKSAVTVTDKAYLILVNKQNPCGEDYAPENISAVPSELTLYGKEVKLEANAALAAEALILELHARGYTDIVATSGYRDYAYQQILFNTYLGNEMAKHPGWTQDQCEAEVLSYSARPGESEHQTGLCVDLISINHPSLDESFAQNAAYEWLTENAHFFGFILRYPEDGEAVTGYSYEPWHYRFVGVKAATEIYEKDVTLEEYSK